MRAYRTEALGVDSVVLTRSLKRARYVTWRDAREAGFSPSWGDIRAVRAPELDCVEALPDRCLTPEHL